MNNVGCFDMSVLASVNIIYGRFLLNVKVDMVAHFWPVREYWLQYLVTVRLHS